MDKNIIKAGQIRILTVVPQATETSGVWRFLEAIISGELPKLVAV